jgi:hypothetical protein
MVALDSCGSFGLEGNIGINDLIIKKGDNVLVFPTIVDGDLRLAVKIIDFGEAREVGASNMVTPSASDRKRIPFLWTHPDIFGLVPFDPYRADGIHNSFID